MPSFALLLRELALWPLCLIPEPILLLLGVYKKGKGPSSKIPIVFLHGFLATNSGYLLLKWRLEQQGFQIHLPRLGWFAQEKIEVLAERLAQDLERNNIKKCILLGHSTGGLVGYLYAQQHPSSVTKLIALGVPFSGSPLAKIAFFSVTARQLIPGNPFLRRFKGPKPFKARAYSVMSAQDEVVPLSSARLRGAKTVRLDGLGHLELLFSHRTVQALGRILGDHNS